MPDAGTWDQLLGVTQAKLAGNKTTERRKVPVAHVSPNAEQPRKFFDAQALTELTASVTAHGVLQPILVRPHPSDPARYQIVAGERRWLAAQQAGLFEVPVVVRELSDQETLELGLVENVLREDITPMEEARALKRLIDAFGYSYAKLGERLGKNKAYVDHRVRLLKLPPELQNALERGLAEGEEGKVRRPFTPRHAGAVAQLPDEDARVALIEAVFAEGLSVAQTLSRVRGVGAPAVLESIVPGTAVPAVAQPVAMAVAVEAPVEIVEPVVPTAAVLPEAPMPNVDVAVDTLAVYQLIMRAQRGNGRMSAAKLLKALQADKKSLMACLAGVASASEA